jgi:hypothetical protein
MVLPSRLARSLRDSGCKAGIVASNLSLADLRQRCYTKATIRGPASLKTPMSLISAPGSRFLGHHRIIAESQVRPEDVRSACLGKGGGLGRMAAGP